MKTPFSWPISPIWGLNSLGRNQGFSTTVLGPRNSLLTEVPVCHWNMDDACSCTSEIILSFQALKLNIFSKQKGNSLPLHLSTGNCRAEDIFPCLAKMQNEIGYHNSSPSLSKLSQYFCFPACKWLTQTPSSLWKALTLHKLSACQPSNHELLERGEYIQTTEENM